MREIVILTYDGTGANPTSFMGRWLAQYLDPATGGRYSVAQRADGAFVTIAKYDSREPVEMRVFADATAIRDADLPVSLKSAAEKAPDARGAPQLQVVQRIPKEQPPDPEPPRHPVPPPTAPCGICGSRDFWRGASGGFVCYRCTPPPKPDHHIEQWWCVVPEIGEDW
jgi:hypothetical protein